MRKPLKIFLILAAVVILVGLVGYYKIMYKPHRDARDEKGIAVTAQSIADAYVNDEKKADSLYLDKAIEVSGTVMEISKNQQGKTVVALQTSDPMAGVRCTMKEDAVVKQGDAVTIKGICTGYLADVTLIECYIDK